MYKYCLKTLIITIRNNNLCCTFHEYLLYTFMREQWFVDTISSQTIQNVRVAFQKMFSGIRYGNHVPVWATPSLFNTSCNSQESDTTAARKSPQLSDLVVVLSRPTTYYIFLRLRRKWCMKCVQSAYVELKLACKKPKQRGSHSFPVTPQSSKINLLASWFFTWPYNP